MFAVDNRPTDRQDKITNQSFRNYITMKLHQLAPSPSARRVGIFLKEIGLEIETVHVDIRAGENLTEAFLGKSANGRIPLLELDDGNYICESVAICRYLEASTEQHQSLFGNTALEQAQVEMWQRMVELQGLFPALQAFRNISGVYADRENCIPSWGEESKLRLISFLPTLETQLATNKFIAGERFSIADITLFVLINFAKNIKVEIPEELSHLALWFETVAARPSVQ